MTRLLATATNPELPDRDRHIVQLVARHQQLSASHIQTLLFNTVGRTPVDRALRRLVANQYLIRVERRIVGGARGGSGQYVYALGRRGFYLHFEGKYSPARTVRYHALAIVDCVVVLRQLERDGVVSIAGISTEPDCWVTIGRHELKPDLYVDLTWGGEPRPAVLEVDMGTEGQGQLKSKLERYWHAYNEADPEIWTRFPKVIWVAIDEERAKELSWLISQGPADAQQLFQVTMIAALPTLFE